MNVGSEPSGGTEITNSASVNLKRTRRGGRRDSRIFDGADAPPIPKLRTDIILQVFTHKSLRHAGCTDVDDYGDNERLSVLGKAALEAAVTYALFNECPMLKTADILDIRETVLSDDMIDCWVAHYGLTNKLRCHPDFFPALSDSLETRTIFHAYVGGVLCESGPVVVNSWIGQLIRKDIHKPTAVPESTFQDATATSPEVPPQKKVKSEPPERQSPLILFGTQPPESRDEPLHARLQPSHSQPTVNQGLRAASPPTHSSQESPARPNPLSPARPSLPFLPLFNQTASQRRVVVEYPAESAGPAHARRWTVYCEVNGIRKGSGTGSSKQVAKEEAARQAFQAMGWS